MISQTAEYALRAVVYLAQSESGPVTAQQVAEHTKVPSGYLSKVLQALARGGIVDSQRGLHGGFRLAHDPQKLTMLEVVNSVDAIQRIESCPLGLSSHVNLCPLHKRLDEALAHIEVAFGNTSIKELMTPTTGSTPLCEFPKAVDVTTSAKGS